MSRTRYGDVQATHICQESQAALNASDGVRADAIEDHDVFLTTLESINCVYLYIV